MKISIITVVYNRANTISRAIQSVRGQGYSSIEHIIIDGGSSDGTLEKIHASKSEDAILVSERDAGIYDAINKGLGLATGDVIGFLHSDDVFSDDRVLFEICEQFIDAAVDAVYGDVSFFSPRDPGKVVRRYRSSRFKPSLLGWGWMPAHTALFLRKKIYDRFGVYRTDYSIASDFEFICRIFHGGDLQARYLPRVLVNMQKGGLSTAGLSSTLLINIEMVRACRENNIQTSWLKMLSRFFVKIFEFVVR